MSKIYVFLADGFEEIEGLTVVDLLRRAELDTVMVSVTGDKKVTGSHEITVQADALIEEIDFSKADMLVLPGGLPGTTNLGACELLTGQLKAFHDAGKRIAAICAAPSVLGGLGILKGKKATCYPSFEPKLQGASPVTDEVVTDGSVTTSRGLGTAIPFALELIRVLKDEQRAEQIKKAIIYRACD